MLIKSCKVKCHRKKTQKLNCDIPFYFEWIVQIILKDKSRVSSRIYGRLHRHQKDSV